MRIITVKTLAHCMVLRLFTLFCFFFLLPACGDSNTRTDYQTFNGIAYGQIHRTGSQLLISIKNVERMSEEEVFKFAYCLALHELSIGRETEYVRIYNRFHYVDQIPQDLKELYEIRFSHRADGQNGVPQNTLFISDAKRKNAEENKPMKIKETYPCQ